VENCGNTLILRCSASEGGGTARFASGLIGEREIFREQITKSYRPGEFRASKSVTEHQVTESTVLASEIEQLPDLAGFLKLAVPTGMEASPHRSTFMSLLTQPYKSRSFYGHEKTTSEDV